MCKHPEYSNRKDYHVCSVNHTASLGAMEPIDMLWRSIEKNNLIYHKYLGDGATPSFKAVVNLKPYKKYNITQRKLECVGHVQKTLGTRLWNIVKGYKGTSTTTGRRSQLNENTINSMQNFYGAAIPQNLNNKYKMKKEISAILSHYTGITDAESWHRFFPPREDGWYKYKKDIVTGKSTHKKTINLPK